MVDSKLAAKLLFGTAALSALGFALLSAIVARGKASQADRALRRKIREWSGGGGHSLGIATTPLGKWYAHLPAALATARKLERRGHRAAALTIAATSAGAALLSEALDRVTPPRQPPPESNRPWTHSYPSGHALQTSALAFSSSYVLVREGLSSPWSVVPFSLASLATGAGRLLLGRHWASDVLGGYFAGAALGASCAGVYELSRSR